MHEIDVLRDFVILFSLAVVVVVLCHRVRLPAIVGFLITGVLAGPSALGLIDDKESVELIAELGVVLLLFTVGIDFSLERLYRIRWVILVGGGLQVVLTLAITAAVAGLFRLSLAQAVFLGMLVALSSTAVVLKLLAEKAELEAPHGRVTLAILIFQDLCIVPMMIICPFLAGEGGDLWQVVWKLVQAFLMIGGALICGKFVFPWILTQVVRTRNREVFILVTIILCVGTALVSNLAGLSLALGAFLAGLIVSQSEYSHQVLGEIVPFRDAFGSLFFISIGMLLDLTTLGQPLLLIAGVAALIAVKALVAASVTFVLGYGLRVSIAVGLTLAQIGEFSFILAETGVDVGLLSPYLYQLFLASAIITMTLTPLSRWMRYPLTYMAERILPVSWSRTRRSKPDPELTEDLKDHVIIIGFGPTGRNLAHVLRRVDVPYIVVEMNSETVVRERRRGEAIFYGDASLAETLSHAGIESARVLVIAISDAAAVRQSTALARRLHPGLHVIVRTRYLDELQPLLELGASDVVPEELETSIEVFARTLRHLLVPRDIVESIVREVRCDGYGALREPSDERSPKTRVGAIPNAELEVLRVEAGSPLVGKTLGESELRSQSGASVLAIQADEEAEFQLNPPVTTRLATDARAILFGSPEQVSRAAELFRGDAELSDSGLSDPERTGAGSSVEETAEETPRDAPGESK